MAWIWFSCFCSASENFRLMPAAAAASLTDLVFAARQPLSEPTWEKPRVMVFGAAPVPPVPPGLVAVDFFEQAARVPVTATAAVPVRKCLLLIMISPLRLSMVGRTRDFGGAFPAICWWCGGATSRAPGGGTPG